MPELFSYLAKRPRLFVILFIWTVCGLSTIFVGSSAPLLMAIVGTIIIWAIMSDKPIDPEA